MEQADYQLFTGTTVAYSEEDWARLVNVAEGRLASFLCLDSLPSTLPDDLAELLANFIHGVLAHQGDDTPIEEKRIRNFTIRFTTSSAANAFAEVAKNYYDTIEKYSNCGSGIAVEKSERSCCDGYIY